MRIPAQPKVILRSCREYDPEKIRRIFREGLGQYQKALRNREKYLELWPDSKDKEAVSKSIIDLYEVPCPEGTYAIYIDAYVCPVPPGQPVPRD